jgi:hypothetical protein
VLSKSVVIVIQYVTVSNDDQYDDVQDKPTSDVSNNSTHVPNMQSTNNDKL